MSSIITNGALDIDVGGTTSLIGGTIGSRTDDFRLSTEELITEDLADTDRSRSFSLSVSSAPNEAGPNLSSFSGIGGSFSSSVTEGETFATLGRGEITIGGTRVDEGEGPLAGLNRDLDANQIITRDTSFDTGGIELDVGALVNVGNNIEAVQAGVDEIRARRELENILDGAIDEGQELQILTRVAFASATNENGIRATSLSDLPLQDIAEETLRSRIGAILNSATASEFACDGRMCLTPPPGMSQEDFEAMRAEQTERLIGVFLGAGDLVTETAQGLWSLAVLADTVHRARTGDPEAVIRVLEINVAIREFTDYIAENPDQVDDVLLQPFRDLQADIDAAKARGDTREVARLESKFALEVVTTFTGGGAAVNAVRQSGRAARLADNLSDALENATDGAIRNADDVSEVLAANADEVVSQGGLLPSPQGIGSARRDLPGVASHGGGLPRIGPGDPWLRGTDTNAGRVPAQIAEELSGRQFRNFDHFRQEFWKAVSRDPELSARFGQDSLREIRAGRAPFAPGSQQVGNRVKFELDHNQELQNGGNVFDFDNIIIRTPLNHIGGK